LECSVWNNEKQNEKGLIAVVMCTHNHPEIVREILELSADDYKECGIDIYYFDSSTNDTTKSVVEEYQKKGYDNLFYVPCPSMDLYEKISTLLAQEGLNKKYRYVWPSKDRCSYKMDLLNKIIEAANLNYDAIHLTGNDSPKEEYNSALEFYHDWGAWVTSINTTIYNAETLLKDYKRSKQKQSSDSCFFYFNHYYHFFNELSKLDSVKIKVINSIDSLNMLYVPKSNVFELITIWEYRWYEVNEALPAFYDSEKEYVVKTTASLPWLLSDRKKLMEYHADGILTEETLPYFLDGWDKVSYIPKNVVIKIAKDNYDIKYDLSQIKGVMQFLDDIIGVTELLREGLLPADKFPKEAVCFAVKAVLSSKENKTPEDIIKAETANCILEEMERKSMSSGVLADHLQQLITCFI